MADKKLNRANTEDILGLSSIQEELLFHYIKNPQGNQYFEQLNLTLSGELDIEKMNKALAHVVKSNEMLRTVFRWRELNTPIQIILRNIDIEIREYDLSGIEYEILPMELKKIRQIERSKINLEEKPFRVALVRYNRGEWELIISNHHILYDGWSNSILLNELMEAYHLLSKNKKLMLTAKTKYKAYLNYIKDSGIEEKKAFWKKYLDNIQLKTLAYQNQNSDDVITERVYYNITGNFYKKIIMYINNKEITIAPLLYSAWGILLLRYTNSTDTVFGVTVSGRDTDIPNMDQMIGLFINTMPIRVLMNGEKSLWDTIKELNNDLIAIKTNSLPLSKVKPLVTASPQEELFDSIFVLENYPIGDSVSKTFGGGLQIDDFLADSTNDFNLVFEAVCHEELKLTINYNRKVFSEAYMKRMLDHYLNILNEIITNDGKKACKTAMLSEQEARQISEISSCSVADKPIDTTLHTLFEEQVSKTPQNIALEYEEESMTYSELNNRANQLAIVLRNSGVKEESIVGLYANNSFQMIIGILGILKAGGAYLPLTPDNPAKRLKSILDDAKIKMLVSESGLNNRDIYNGKTVYINKSEQIVGYITNPVPVSTSCNSAYVIYTSGSTGQPTGVVVEHKSIINTLIWRIKHYEFKEPIVLQLLSFMFDSSIESVFTALLTGGTLVLCHKGKQYDSQYIGSLIKQKNVTHFSIVPDFYKLLLDEIPNELGELESVTLGGEKCTATLIRKHFDRINHVRLYNEYGPTENSVTTTISEIRKNETTITIGRPINNVSCFILDKYLNYQPIGIPGELYIAGEGLARGYLNSDALNKERFLTDKQAISKRLYKTGDCVAWTQQGNIEFIGRIDYQVKIRGHRINIEEVEKHILQHGNVKEAVVTVRKNIEQNSYLSGFVVFEKETDVNELQDFLKKQLPQYMIPSKITVLSALPLTRNGKIDRKAIANMEEYTKKGIGYDAPKGEYEQKLESMWKKILNLEQISRHDRFFDIGGDSILLMKLHSMLEKEFEGQFELVDLFDHPTIYKLAVYIREKEVGYHKTILPQEFFNNWDSEGRAGELIFNFSSKIMLEIKDVVMVEEIEIAEFLFLLYMYVLHLVGGGNMITAHFMDISKGTYKSVSIDFSGDNDFHMLIGKLKNKLEKSTKEQSIREPSHKGMADQQDPYILPCFFFGNLLDHDLQLENIYDISVGFENEKDRISFIYNNRINKAKVEEIVEIYTQFIKAVLEKYRQEWE